MHDKRIHFIFSKNPTDDLVIKDLSELPTHEFRVLESGPEKLKRAFIESNVGLGDYLDEHPHYQSGKSASIVFRKVNNELLPKHSIAWGKAKADWHNNEYDLMNALQEMTKPSKKLENFSVDDIFGRVNDPSFHYEFEESVKAYNAGLYLAAAATGGIAMENILRLIIIKKLGRHKLPSKSYISWSLKVLDEKKILPGRLSGEVSGQISIRNSNSHTNDDPVRKETVDAIYRIINDLTLLLV